MKTKLYLFFLLPLTGFLTSSVQAQTLTQYGMKLGILSSSISQSFDPIFSDQFDRRVGLIGSVYADWVISTTHFSTVLEVGRYGFEETGAVRFGEFLRDNATLDLVSLSILLSEKKENERFYFFSGPRLDYLFHWIPVTVQEDNSTIHEVSPSMSFDRMTLAVVLGVGINFKFKETRTLSFETKYGWDLTNSTRTLAKSTRKNSLAFVLSVPFSSP